MVGHVRVPLIIALLAAAAATCALGGLPRDRAIELALGSSSAAADAAWAESGPLGRFADARTLPDERRDRQVWAVMLRGSFPGSCVLNAAGESVCPPDASGMLVVIDYHTGEFIFSETR